MSNKDLKIGDAVSFEYRDTYDREIGTGIIVEINKENGYKVALIEQEKDEWFWTNYWSWNKLNKLRSLNKNVKDYGLKL